MDVSCPRGLNDFSHADLAFQPVNDVVKDREVKEDGFLTDHAEEWAKGSQVELFDVGSIDGLKRATVFSNFLSFLIIIPLMHHVYKYPFIWTLLSHIQD